MADEQGGSPPGEEWRDEREVRIRARPEQVWRAWADPEIIRQWFADDAEGRAEPGGTIIHRFPHFGFEHFYEVLEADPPQRLLLRADLGGGEMLQEILIESRGGETVLRLVHSGFAAGDEDPSRQEELEGIDSGWRLALAVLRHYLENHFGRERRTLFVLQPASFSYDDLPAFYRSAEGLAGWLTRSGSIGATGERSDLVLRNGALLDGVTLEWTGREAAVSWEQVSGVVELKAFGSSPERRLLAVRLNSWGEAAPLPLDETWLHECLGRLSALLAKTG